MDESERLAEHALLGACLLNAKAPLIASEYVKVSDFNSPDHQLIYDAIQNIVGRGAEADPVSVCSELGGMVESSYVFSLPQLCPAVTNVQEYALQVYEASIDRRVRELVSADSGHRGTELLVHLQEALYEVDTKRHTSVNMADVWQRLKQNANVPLAPSCEYPWERIQRCTRGLRPGWLCVLAGEPSHGKTAAALSITEKAIRAGKVVVLVSLEMDKEAVAIRIAQRFGFNADHYFDCKLNDYDLGVIDELAAESIWKNLHLEQDIERTSQIPMLLRRWKPDLLVIDHLQLLAGGEEYKELAKTTRLLKLYAERFSAPILCLSQLSRVHGDEQGRMPKLQRLRGSGTIEQDADTVVFVWRKRDENEVLTSEGYMVVAKSRMGKLGGVRMSFDGDTQTFKPIVEGYTI